MKILTFVKIASLATLGSGAIASAVVFSDINTIATPYTKVMTKDYYLTLKEKQNTTGALSIDYSALPTSDVSVCDLLEHKNLNNVNGYMFVLGSEAYMQTNSILKGVNKAYADSNPFEINSSALMLKLYDLFYNEASDNHIAVKDFNVNFYSFLDIVNTKQTIASANLLQERRARLGKLPASDGTDVGTQAGASNVWEVTNPDTNIKEERPIVKSSSGSSSSIPFNYNPETDYYEFLPNNEFETKYEKVYFRNQNDVALFNNTVDWMNSYASSYLTDITFTKEGCILAAKEVDGVWSLRMFSYASKIDDFITFYNPDYDLNGDNEENNQDNNADSEKN